MFILVSVNYSQNIVTINVMDSITSKPLGGVMVSILNTDFKTGSDSLGTAVFRKVPDGYYTFYITYVGYNPYSINFEISSKEENFFTVKIPKPKNYGRDY